MPHEQSFHTAFVGSGILDVAESGVDVLRNEEELEYSQKVDLEWVVPSQPHASAAAGKPSSKSDVRSPFAGVYSLPRTRRVPGLLVVIKKGSHRSINAQLSPVNLL